MQTLFQWNGFSIYLSNKKSFFWWEGGGVRYHSFNRGIYDLRYEYIQQYMSNSWILPLYEYKYDYYVLDARIRAYLAITSILKYQPPRVHEYEYRSMRASTSTQRVLIAYSHGRTSIREFQSYVGSEGNYVTWSTFGLLQKLRVRLWAIFYPDPGQPGGGRPTRPPSRRRP